LFGQCRAGQLFDNRHVVEIPLKLIGYFGMRLEKRAAIDLFAAIDPPHVLGDGLR
jgi:hypothetical protein